MATIAIVVWALTLGLHIGSLPGRIYPDGRKDGRVFSVEPIDGQYWEELVEGKRSFYMTGFMKVPEYQVGIPFLFTLRGAAWPASIDLSLITENRFEGNLFVIEKATLVYDSGHSHEIIFESGPRSGILSTVYKEEGKFCIARVAIPSCIEHKRDYTIEVHGFIEDGEEDIRIREDVRMLYSEKKFVYLGWWCLFARMVSRMSA